MISRILVLVTGGETHNEEDVMRKRVEIDESGGTVEVRLAAGFAGVGKTVVASLFDATGTNPKSLAIKIWDSTWSGVELRASSALDHVLYLQFNAASLVSTPELVNAIVRVHQGAEIARFETEPEMVEAAELVKFKILIDLKAPAA
jgi:hypothetical protein